MIHIILRMLEKTEAKESSPAESLELLGKAFPPK